jgi:Neuraminidase (sialidase)
MLIRTNWDYFYESFSSDHGLTWSDYEKTSIDASSSPGALKRLQSGRLILVWNRLYHQGKDSVARQGGDSNLNEVAASWQRDELSLMYSDDDGKTWSEPVIVAKNAVPTSKPLSTSGRIDYPLIFEAAKGEIWITAYGNLKIKILEKDL